MQKYNCTDRIDVEKRVIVSDVDFLWTPRYPLLRADQWTMSIFANPVPHMPKPEDTIKDLKSLSAATLILNLQMHA